MEGIRWLQGAGIAMKWPMRKILSILFFLTFSSQLWANLENRGLARRTLNVVNEMQRLLLAGKTKAVYELYKKKYQVSMPLLNFVVLDVSLQMIGFRSPIRGLDILDALTFEAQQQNDSALFENLLKVVSDTAIPSESRLRVISRYFFERNLEVSHRHVIQTYERFVEEEDTTYVEGFEAANDNSQSVSNHIGFSLRNNAAEVLSYTERRQLLLSLPRTEFQPQLPTLAGPLAARDWWKNADNSGYAIDYAEYRLGIWTLGELKEQRDNLWQSMGRDLANWYAQDSEAAMNHAQKLAQMIRSLTPSTSDHVKAHMPTGLMADISFYELREESAFSCPAVEVVRVALRDRTAEVLQKAFDTDPFLTLREKIKQCRKTVTALGTRFFLQQKPGT